MDLTDKDRRLEEISQRRAEIEMTNEVLRRKNEQSKELIARTRMAYEKIQEEERQTIDRNEKIINEQIDEYCRLGKERKQLRNPKKSK